MNLTSIRNDVFINFYIEKISLLIIISLLVLKLTPVGAWQIIIHFNKLLASGIAVLIILWANLIKICFTSMIIFFIIIFISGMGTLFPLGGRIVNTKINPLVDLVPGACRNSTFSIKGTR